MSEPDIAQQGQSHDPRNIVLDAAVLLQNNGQATSTTLLAVDRLNSGLGIHSQLVPSWQSLILAGADPRAAAVTPTGVNMRRVAAAMRVIDRAEDGPLDPVDVAAGLCAAATLRQANAAVFVLACATGAAALAAIFGAEDVRTALLAAASAAAGGVIRRMLGRFGLGVLVQAFAAAVVAGIVGAVAVHLHLGAAGVVALCPALILVPGPHILNGALDLISLRVSLGMARVGYASIVLTVIASGLIVGLGMGGQTLPVTGGAVAVPLHVDVLAAAVAAASYSVYFSMPYRMIGWPVLAGMAAHGVHWWASSVVGTGPATAALLSCLLVGAMLVPMSHFLRMPFAAIGFAAVVSLVPGMFVFRALSGMLQLQTDASAEVLAAAVSDSAVAAGVVAAMAIGLVVPIRLRDNLIRRHSHGKS
ncbi:threonine/serine exporter family protein [Mycolicibacterium mengxianglii]|uniref:threonine/serine exporter family protein n=1 Tax=Mycolicibacterium mengxianglii TaxID=2736649 RepID=UPI0018D01443|nr:threonine/serine exporter family protein [Mycolicibacterium mengxianglii]